MLIAIISTLLFTCIHGSNLTDIFEKVYKEAWWGVDENQNGTSGSGSEPKNAVPYIDFLKNFMAEKNIQSVVDAGCGDWQIARTINWEGINYLGFDASKTVIENNKNRFGKENIHFYHENFLDIDLPAADLLILKDVLQHLSLKNISKAITQFKKFKYVIIVNDIDPQTLSSRNFDIQDGNYRTLDITAAPFYVDASRALTYKPAFSYETKLVLLVDNTK